MTPPAIELHGLLGDALAANLRGRLSHFIVDETSPAIALFSPAHRAQNHEGDWYGEHAGKWLVAAAKAAARSGDATLTASVRRVADWLASVQEDDGYLGTYAPERRFMQPQPPKPVSWNGEPSVRTWDIWTHAYLILGFVEASRQLQEPRWLAVAQRIGDLCCRVIGAHGLDITELGNHFGMSATVLLDPIVELYDITREPRYLDLARTILAQADAEPHLGLLTRALAGADASEIATGKAYQLAWNLVGLAKLHRVTGEPTYLAAVEHLWRNIRDHHLSLGGGPWGGVAHRSREVFNPAGTFDPHAYVETCSTLAWMQLNRELLRITGAAQYAEEIERSAYNDLIGAQAPNGEDWCYYVFPNGKRVHTTYWRCCKSSGSMAVEELPALAYAATADGTLSVNVLGPGRATFETADAGCVTLEQRTRFPADGAIELRVDAECAVRFALRIRIPSWADDATLRIDGVAIDQTPVPGTYITLQREWRGNEVITLHLPMSIRTHRAVHGNVQVSRAPDGSAVEQQVLRFDYVALTRGPLVYATGLVDGYRTGETVCLPDDTDAALTLLPSDDSDGAPGVAFAPLHRAPLVFRPWYRAGGRIDGSWRLTWLAVAPDGAAPHTP